MKLRLIATTLLVATLLVGCGGSKTSYTAGTYTGTAQGLNGEVKVEVTVDEASITEVKVVEEQETPEIAGPAIEQIPAAIVKDQKTEVEVVSGATVTSQAIIDATNAALEEASK